MPISKSVLKSLRGLREFVTPLTDCAETEVESNSAGPQLRSNRTGSLVAAASALICARVFVFVPADLFKDRRMISKALLITE